ncbi:FAD:protein FMN transferase [Pedomonas mirosovicensis]|uniref:FAD:protein FMN transferase n=1 Tax=Pedomonas mirosovicensis TaxID=2908641 RepID=UPI002168F5DE|nr:FAD:protein FMN transferase [Pedomonas mirosovicensis]MCH8686327.1 FAD:protein FMN transferase [Pedomonas mirosovicensis]
MRILVPTHLSPLAIANRVPSAPVETLGGRSMGTSWSVRYVAPPASGLSADAVAALVGQQLAEVIDQMSQWEKTSLLCRFNRAAPNTWHELPPAFRTVLNCALEITEESEGAFDPTLGALVDLWGFGPAPARATPPSPQEIEAARARTGWRKIGFDAARRAIRQPGGVRLDFSGIAKGFAVDHVAEGLRLAGLRHFLVEIGGELRGEGVKPDGSPWWVTIERPARLPQNAAGWQETRVALHGLAIATSGDYRRWFESKGRHYSHTLDPRTGWPIENSIVSATVLHPSCMKADAYATALGVLGADAALQLATGRDIAACLIRRTGEGVEEILSPAFRQMLD